MVILIARVYLEILRLRSDVLLRAYPKNDIVLELVILNGAKRSEVSHNMPAGDFSAVLEILHFAHDDKRLSRKKVWIIRFALSLGYSLLMY